MNPTLKQRVEGFRLKSEAHKVALDRMISADGTDFKKVVRENAAIVDEYRNAMASDVEPLVDDLCAEIERLREALEGIAAGNPASPGKWLSDIEMANIARKALNND